MRARFLALAAASAAILLPASPALAQATGAFALSAAPSGGGAGVRVHRGGHDRDPFAGQASGRFGPCDFGGGGGRHGRRGGTTCEFSFGTWVNGGEWARYNNRSWEPDSFNDWWHDRPDRAFPRWVQEQRGGFCSPDRMWWSGSGWRC